MQKLLTILLLAVLVACAHQSISRYAVWKNFSGKTYEDSLRHIYSQPNKFWPAPMVSDGIEWLELGALPKNPIDTSNPLVADKVALGKALFFDSRLSGSNKISCASCHNPTLHFTDGKIKSLGHEEAENKRNSQGLFNIWADKSFFWDGRAKDLEDQVFFPINSETEMHSEMPEAVGKIRRVQVYQDWFKRVYGEQPNPDNLANAIATFEQTLQSGESAFDRFLKGEKSALGDAALRGLQLFRTKAGCMDCHSGPFLKDQKFHNLGFGKMPGLKEDIGRLWVTKDSNDLGKVKTPGLRDVVHTGPWMHNGAEKDLDNLLKHLNEGLIYAGSLSANIDSLVKPRNLTVAELKDLLAFLEAVSAPAPPFQQPIIPR